MLAIELTFLTDRYVATSYNDRRRAEWPPHPARFFSALAATHFAADPCPAEEREALAWLEALEAPQLAVPAASEREVVTVFVPVNDGSLLKSFDDLRDKLDAARTVDDKKAVAKLDKKLREAIAKDAAAPDKYAKEAPAAALSLLPEHRGKQPRTFPSVTPATPKMTFIWPDATPTPGRREALDRLLARLTRVGHSSSLVSAQLVDAPPTPTLVPAEVGMRLRTTRPGQLMALEEAFLRHRETEPRVMPARFQSYAPVAGPRALDEAASVFSDEWLVLASADGPVLPITAGPAVARAVRRALMSFHDGGPVPAMLSGHTPEGAPSGLDHLAIVALPYVGGPHADGALLGLALVFPRQAGDEARRTIYRDVADWEARARGESQNEELPEGAVPRVALNLGAPGVWLLERVEGLPKLKNLQSAGWCGPARTWSSATPVALDRNPGELRARDPARLARALGEARATIVAACVRIGLPEPREIEILPAAPWSGAAKAKHYPSFSQGKDRGTPRVLTHARLVFPMAVRGPVLLGAGRYHGLGLFRPESSLAPSAALPESDHG